VKDALERSSEMVSPDVRRDLVSVRRKAWRAVVFKRVGGALLATALLVTAVFLGPRFLDASRSREPARPGSSAATMGPVGTYPLVGAWTQEQSCGDFVRTLTAFGLSDHIPRLLVGNGYRPGPGRRIATQTHLCKGSGPAIQRTWTFDGTRLLGFANGKQVDYAIPEIVDDHAFRVSHINFGFRIDGDTIRFIVPPVPRSCTGPDCLSQHAWAVAAFGMGPWHRVAQ
jgi:hypothetical protein